MTHYRSIFISDIHLGSKASSANILLDFLKENDSDYLYLVGDIIDIWNLKRNWYWPQEHNDVIQKLLRKSRKKTNVVYILGNHDEFIRDFTPISFGDIKIVKEAIHISLTGQKYLVIHGDDFDVITKYAKWLAVLGDIGYNFLVWLNRHFNFLRRKLGFGYWSLSAFVKRKVKKAANFIDDYEVNLAKEVKKLGMDGIISGHIHHAEIKEIDGIMYMNDGDWCESNTAIVEHHDGRFEIIHWNHK